MKDTRTLKQVEKAVTQMRKRVASAVRKYAKLQARIQKLQADGRIISMHKDAPIVAGINCHYVKATSLNIDPDAESNWYYQVLFIEEYGIYQCSCEDIRSHTCKHGTELSNHFEDEAKSQADQVAAVAEVKAEAKMDAFKRGMEEQYASDPRTEMVRERETAVLNGSNRGFSLYR